MSIAATHRSFGLTAPTDRCCTTIKPDSPIRIMSAQQTVTKPVGWSQKTYGALRPQSTPQPTSIFTVPPYRYAMERHREELLSRCAESPGDPFDGVLLRYADPLSGGPTLPTMNCEVQMFRPGEKGRSHRHTHTRRVPCFSRLGHDLDRR